MYSKHEIGEFEIISGVQTGISVKVHASCLLNLLN